MPTTSRRHHRPCGGLPFRYDDDNNLVQIFDADANKGGTPPDSASTMYDYDERNLLEFEIFPQGSDGRLKRRYDYDPGGRLTVRTVYDLDQPTNIDRIEITNYDYDQANRLISRSYPSEAGAPVDTFGYDLASRLLSAISSRYDVSIPHLRRQQPSHR